MNNESAFTPASPGRQPASAASEMPTAPAKRPRIWLALVFVGLYWAVDLGARWLELPIFPRFLTLLASWLLLTLLFSIWWLAFARSTSIRIRLPVFGVAVGAGIAAGIVSPNRGGDLVAWALFVVPLVFTVWALALLATRWTTAGRRCLALMAVLFVTWGVFAQLQPTGLKGGGEPEFRWRWSLTAEDLYLRERANQTPAAVQAAPVEMIAGDWPGFRGPARDSAVHGVKIMTDWDTYPPRPVWKKHENGKKRIGPAWSSVAVVGGRLYTQEQRGPKEAVVCLDANTGDEIWSHEDELRFQDAQSGAGPRATPSFADGRIYTLGATGILNCLDAATGSRYWSRNITDDASDAKVPQWGFSGSPLVSAGKVIVFAGGDGTGTLLAYDANKGGSPAWTADAGKNSYSSPHPANIGGVDQVLMASDSGLLGFNPATGALLWKHAPDGFAPWPCLQPHAIGDNRFVVATDGMALQEVKHAGDNWSTEQSWTSNDMKPSFNDFVVHGDFAYGLDNKRLTCLDLKTGKRRWKGEDFGHGQILLLADQLLLLVLSEEGAVTLVAANPKKYEPLAAFQAIKGKTWNHPVIAHNRLYVRNSEEIACYELTPAGP